MIFSSNQSICLILRFQDSNLKHGSVVQILFPHVSIPLQLKKKTKLQTDTSDEKLVHDCMLCESLQTRRHLPMVFPTNSAQIDALEEALRSR